MPIMEGLVLCHISFKAKQIKYIFYLLLKEQLMVHVMFH